MIILFVGGMGSGKTLSMTKHLHEDCMAKKEIYTNYRLTFGNPTYLTAGFFKNYKDFNVKNASIAIDEAHVFIDSRSSQSKKNKMFTRFITQSRKRAVTLYCTTQHFRQVDVRLRNLADLVVECRRVISGNVHYVKNDYYRWQSLGFVRFRTSCFTAAPIYPLYDTTEIIDFDEDG